MPVFVPVIVSENPLESFSDDTLSLHRAIAAVSDSDFFAEPFVVTQSSLLDTAIELVGEMSGRTTFVAVPDGSGHAIHAAVGCVSADIGCEDLPILLMDARADRRKHDCLARNARGALAAVLNNKLVGFSLDGDPVGDYAFTFSTVREEFMDRAPGIIAYAMKAAASSMSRANISVMPDAPFIFRDPGTFESLIASPSDRLRNVSYLKATPQGYYTPWKTANTGHDSFYAPSMGA